MIKITIEKVKYKIGSKRLLRLLTILPTTRIFPDTDAYAPPPGSSKLGGIYSRHKLVLLIL